MDNHELQDLIDCIKIEIQYDRDKGITRYKLPQKARNPKVIEALESNFEHYESTNMDGDFFVIIHPRP